MYATVEPPRAKHTPSFELLQQYFDAYENRSWETVSQLFCADPSGFGTGCDENLRGISEIERQHKRDWSQSAAVTLKIKEILHEVENFVAVVWAAQIEFEDGSQQVWDDLRASVVVVQEKGAWKMAHFHASAPAAEQEEGHSFQSS